MSVKLSAESREGVIRAKDMKCGQLGVITDSGDCHEGTVVQMMHAGYGLSKNTLYKVGSTNGDSWSAPMPNYKVLLLKPGELIEVVDN